MKKFLINLFILQSLLVVIAQDINITDVSTDATSDVATLPPNRVEFYRSNSNGLSLVQILDVEKSNYKFFLEIIISNNQMTSKTLYKENREIKKWDYVYNNKYLFEESYYKEGLLLQKYYYDSAGHKITEEEYKNNNLIKQTTYKYNNEGLVDLETIKSLISDQITTIKYRYDSLYRIKQIEKKYPDGLVVYWESFLSNKGIMTKEYYTLDNEVYTFLYNQFGQEISGEIRSKDTVIEEKAEKTNKTDKKTDKKEDTSDESVNNNSLVDKNIKMKWENSYTKSGLRDKKVEENFKLNKKTITYFNKDGKETKIEIYAGDELLKIEYYEYDEEKRITYYKIIEDLNVNEIKYIYNDKDIVINTKFIENNKLKREIIINQDGTKDEIIYSQNNSKVIKKYNRNDEEIINPVKKRQM